MCGAACSQNTAEKFAATSWPDGFSTECGATGTWPHCIGITHYLCPPAANWPRRVGCHPRETHSPSRVVQLFCKTPEGSTKVVMALPGETIANVKQAISSKLDSSDLHFDISYSGKRLVDEFTLSDYAIQNHATLDIVYLGLAKADGNTTLYARGLLLTHNVPAVGVSTTSATHVRLTFSKLAHPGVIAECLLAGPAAGGHAGVAVIELPQALESNAGDAGVSFRDFVHAMGGRALSRCGDVSEGWLAYSSEPPLSCEMTQGVRDRNELNVRIPAGLKPDSMYALALPRLASLAQAGQVDGGRIFVLDDLLVPFGTESALEATRSVAKAAAAAASAASSRVVNEAFRCSICFSDCKDPTTAPCGHTFCLAEIQGWALSQWHAGAQNVLCPMCRAVIPDGASSLRVSTAAQCALDPAPAAAAIEAAVADTFDALRTVALRKPERTIQAHTTPLLSFAEIDFVCNSEESRSVIGSDRFWTLFAARLRGEPVCVKSMSPLRMGWRWFSTRDCFWAAVNTLFHLRHDTLVPLLGFCAEHCPSARGLPELALVMPRYPHTLGSLDLFSAVSSTADALAGGKRSRDQTPPPPSLAARLRWLHDVARALRYLHAQGILHGGLHAGAVYVESGGGKAVLGWPRVLAALVAPSPPAYADPSPPSLSQGSNLSADVYAFGVLAWAVLTGRAPVPVASGDSGCMLDSSGLPLSVPLAVRMLIERCCSRTQPLVAELCATLETALEGV